MLRSLKLFAQFAAGSYPAGMPTCLVAGRQMQWHRYLINAC